MSEVPISILHDDETRAVAEEFERALREHLGRLPEPASVVLTLAALEDLPSRESLGDSGLAVLFLPESREFPVEMHERLASYARAERTRLRPVSIAKGRDVPPDPLGGVVSFRLHLSEDGVDAARLDALCKHVLNLSALRVAASRRSVFLSYTVHDGLALAETLSEKLKARGYDVWRDMDYDRDGVEKILEDPKAQETIENAIRSSAATIVLDTPIACTRPWVEEEVRVTMREVQPIVPLVVIDEAAQRKEPRLGGRFPDLHDLQREVRVHVPEMKALVDAIDDEVLDALELALHESLLSHVRTSWRIVPHAERIFRRAEHEWHDLGERLLFHARGPEPRKFTEVRPSLLVRCSPYEYVSSMMLENLDKERGARSETLGLHKALLVHGDVNLRGAVARKLADPFAALEVVTPDELEDNLFGNDTRGGAA